MEDAELGLGRSLCFLGTTAMRHCVCVSIAGIGTGIAGKVELQKQTKCALFFCEFKIKNNKTLKQLVYCMILVLEIFSH